MRLDHLLSRERTQREIQEFIPGRYRGNSVGARKSKKPKRRKIHEARAEWSNDCQIFLNLYRFQGSRQARTECTLKTAQPDGKHLVKKPVAKLWKQSMRAEMRTILQLVSGYSNQSKTLTATQIVTIKLLRAQGGCHGTGRRRKTW